MPVRSMTGYGRAEKEVDGKTWTAEIRCVNNRFLDVKLKLPRGYLPIEERLRKRIQDFHQRGRVDVVLTVDGDFSAEQHVNINHSLAAEYHQALASLAGDLGLTNDISVSLLASLPDVVVREQGEDDLDEIWTIVAMVVEQGLIGCEEMRAKEGRALVADLTARLTLFSETLAQIEAAVPSLVESRARLLEERLNKLLGQTTIEPMRLAQEVALLADKSDVTEEIVRLKSHIEQFYAFLADDDNAIGRKLDFLIQEFLREVNTIASKISDASVAHLTVDLKSELEKMREQVQNIE